MMIGNFGQSARIPYEVTQTAQFEELPDLQKIAVLAIIEMQSDVSQLQWRDQSRARAEAEKLSYGSGLWVGIGIGLLAAAAFAAVVKGRRAEVDET